MSILFDVKDDAVTGEAAGLGMGLVELGSKSAAALEDMVAYAQETQHEKILRGENRFLKLKARTQLKTFLLRPQC